MSLPVDSSCEGRVSLHFTQPGLSMPAASGVVDEKGSEYILTHTGPRELDGHPLGVCGSGFGLVSGYTTLSVRVRANSALKIKSVRTKNERERTQLLSAVAKCSKERKCCHLVLDKRSWVDVVAGCWMAKEEGGESCEPCWCKKTYTHTILNNIKQKLRFFNRRQTVWLQNTLQPSAYKINTLQTHHSTSLSHAHKREIESVFIYIDASFPGTEPICGNPSKFAGISMMFSVTPRNPLEMEFLYQEKVSVVTGRTSWNERYWWHCVSTPGACRWTRVDAVVH